jgi:hypothetical protein
VLVEVIGILFVRRLNVVHEPLPQKIQDSDDVGFATLQQIALIPLDLGHQFGVLFLVRGETRVAGLPHGYFFLQEMGASVHGELTDYIANDVVALSHAHRIGQFVEDGKEFLVLSVKLLDMDAIGIVPRKRGHGGLRSRGSQKHIGAGRRKMSGG